jgi:hypothetical protein
MYIIKKLRNVLIGVLALLYIFFDHILWDKVANPVYKRINVNEFYVIALDYIEFNMNRYLILVSFVSIYGLSKLVEVYSFAFFAEGHVIAGVVMYGIAMIPVIIAFAVLERGKQKLFTFVWFKYLYEKFVALVNYIKSSYAYRRIMLIVKFTKRVFSKAGMFSILLGVAIKKILKRKEYDTEKSFNHI